MTILDVKKIQDAAKKEIIDERTKQATEKLKELYVKEEKAQLVVRNIRREIELYTQEMAELTTYEAAGVDGKSKE